MPSSTIVVADIGGTHARFGLAQFSHESRPELTSIRRYRAAEHAGLASAWQAYAREVGPLPAEAAIAVAAPVDGEVLRFVNSHWVIDRSIVADELGLERVAFLNDFGAVAHAVSVLHPAELAYVAGPEGPLPQEGVTTILGPGTGLGVAVLLQRGSGTQVIETEGAHIGFAPLDEDERRLSLELQGRFGRTSVERVVAGPALHDIYRFFGGRFFEPADAAALWTAALEGRDPAAERAIDLFVRTFGAVAGDLALAHGSNAVVISSGLSQRLAHKLRSPLFVGRFADKGRYRARMEGLPVRLAMHPEPGLLGAAVAFTRTF